MYPEIRTRRRYDVDRVTFQDPLVEASARIYEEVGVYRLFKASSYGSELFSQSQLTRISRGNPQRSKNWPKIQPILNHAKEFSILFLC